MTQNNIEALFQEYLITTDIDVDKCLSDPILCQKVWFDFSNQDLASWVKYQVKLFRYFRPGSKTINSEASINEEQRRFLILTDQNGVVRKIGIRD